MFNVIIINIYKEVEILRRIAEINFPKKEIRERVFNFLNFIIVYYNYKYNPHRELFLRNELIPGGGLNYIPEIEYDHDRVVEEFTAGTMFSYDNSWISELIHNLCDEVSKFYNISFYNYIELQEYNGLFILKNIGDIRSLRYEEAIEYKKHNIS